MLDVPPATAGDSVEEGEPALPETAVEEFRNDDASPPPLEGSSQPSLGRTLDRDGPIQLVMAESSDQQSDPKPRAHPSPGDAVEGMLLRMLSVSQQQLVQD